jgi:putative hydrolase
VMTRNLITAQNNLFMLKIDLHIHSIASGHAFGTFYDIVKEAKRKKMKMIAITDHGPGDPTSGARHHFSMGFRKPEIKGLKVLWGCELNPINENGDLDLKKSNRDRLDILLFGMHDLVLPQMSYEKATNTILQALDTPRIHIFTHPHECLNREYDWERALKKAIDKGILIELNLSQLKSVQLNNETGKLNRIKKMIEIVKENNGMLIVNSDAHFVHEIGDDRILKKYWKELGLTKDLIINNYPKKLEKFLKEKN